MEGYTLKQLKGFKFEVIKDMFDKAFKRVNTFVDMNTELVKGSETRAKGSSKRAGEDLQQESSKKQKLVKDKHGYKMLEEAYERVLWGDLKVMFEPHVEDAVWRNIQGHKVKLWRLYDLCGVHFVRFDNMHVYMLVEKKYYLTPPTITDMLNRKLQADY
ncbi:hypothetical protein Tco_0214912 [Tanacetum coccineum]